MLAMVGTLVGVSAVGASAASNKAPIVIGYITDETGGSASSFANSPYGAEARIDAQNAVGGVNGHKLKLVVQDAQTTPTGNLIAAQTLVENKGALVVMDVSTYTFAAAHYLNQAKEPVVGAATDGPEWGEKPNSNMFSVYGTPLTPYNGKFYTYNSDELKELGVTKLAQSVANAPSAISAANEVFTEAKTYGISDCLDSVVPVGYVNFTTFALQLKALKCNGLDVLGLLNSCIAVQNAIKQADLKIVDLCATGYDQTVLSQPAALAAMQGVYTSAAINVLGNDIDAPTKLYLSRLKKYTTWPGGIPTANMDYAYESADLVIQGLEHAGSNPTRQAFISYLRTVSSYTAGGLIHAPGLNFTHFGTVGSLPKTECSLLYEVKGKSYVPALGGKPVCGKLIAVPASG
jgi:branched-chain amino acid transport system substrate-binding protein